MNDFNLRKYLANNPLLKEEAAFSIKVPKSDIEPEYIEDWEKYEKEYLKMDYKELVKEKEEMERIGNTGIEGRKKMAGLLSAMEEKKIEDPSLKEGWREDARKYIEYDVYEEDGVVNEYDQEEQTEIDMENRVGDEMTENLFGHPGRTGFTKDRTPGHERPKTEFEKWDAMHEDEKMEFLHSHIEDPDDADSYLDASIDELPNHVVAAL